MTVDGAGRRTGVGAAVRPMTAGDVPAAVGVWTAAFTEMRRRFHLPVVEPEAADLDRQEARMHHLRATDPAGSWVAEADGEVVGLSQSLVRDGYWVLALLGVAPGVQRAGVGRALLAAALSHGEGLPGTIQCSRDPAAMRLYQSAGFDLHPAVVAWGPRRPGAVSADPRVAAWGPGDLDVADEVDRAVRGAARRADLAHLLGRPGHRLLGLERRAYAVVTPDRVVTLAALDEEAARAVLATAVARADPAQPFEIGWLTAPQQWAVDTALRAGLELHPTGPLMARGLHPLPAPYLPSGGFG